MADETVGAIAAAFIDQELEVERNRKASFETRGIAVITTSGALVPSCSRSARLSRRPRHSGSMTRAAGC
jgi:hypothetical protein